jgi:DUF971 family protein
MSHEEIRTVSPEPEAKENQPARQLSHAAVTPKKVRVMLTEGTGMEIDWADGHKSAWSFTWLRDACPCATCAGKREEEGRLPGQPSSEETNPLHMYAPRTKPLSVTPVGRYAIQFNWPDGHSGGIYSWSYLRRLCQCGECTFSTTETKGIPN